MNTYNDYWVNEYLQHYGVLGMRWGTRNIRSASTGKRKIGYDEDVIIKKGSSAYRVTANKREVGDTRYLTVDNNDRYFYRYFWPLALRGKTGAVSKSTPLYENKYKTTEVLRSPSAKKREEIATAMAKSKKVAKELAKQHMINQRVLHQGLTYKEAEKAVEKAEKDKDPKYLAEYDQIYKNYTMKALKSIPALYVLGNTGKNQNIRNEYLQRVKKAGYNAVIDDHGADFAYESQRVNAPIISLDSEKSLRPIRSKKITSYNSQRAYNTHRYNVESLSKKMIDKRYVPNVIKTGYGLENYG